MQVFEQGKRGHAQKRHEQGAENVQPDGAHCHEKALLLKEGGHFSGKGGKCREPAQKSGDSQEPPFRGQGRKKVKKADGKANAVAADEVGRKRAHGDWRKQRIEHESQPPAQNRAC